MKPVLKYEAKDGSFHDTEKEALEANKLVDFKEWYREDGFRYFPFATLYGNGVLYDSEDVYKWLFRNKDRILKLLSNE